MKLDWTERALAAYDSNAPELKRALETCLQTETPEIFSRIVSLENEVRSAFAAEIAGTPSGIDLEVVRAAVACWKRRKVELRAIE